MPAVPRRSCPLPVVSATDPRSPRRGAGLPGGRPRRARPARRGRPRSRRMFFTVETWQLWLIVFAIILGATALGLLAGRALRRHSDNLREPVGVVQGALLAFV